MLTGSGIWSWVRTPSVFMRNLVAPKIWTFSFKLLEPVKSLCSARGICASLAGMTADFNDSPGSIFQMGMPPSRVDILQKIEAVDFDEAWANRIGTHIADGVPTFVISRDDLIKNKLAVGRPTGPGRCRKDPRRYSS